MATETEQKSFINQEILESLAVKETQSSSAEEPKLFSSLVVEISQFINARKEAVAATAPTATVGEGVAQFSADASVLLLTSCGHASWINPTVLERRIGRTYIPVSSSEKGKDADLMSESDPVLQALLEVYFKNIFDASIRGQAKAYIELYTIALKERQLALLNAYRGELIKKYLENSANNKQSLESLNAYTTFQESSKISDGQLTHKQACYEAHEQIERGIANEIAVCDDEAKKQLLLQYEVVSKRYIDLIQERYVQKTAIEKIFNVLIWLAVCLAVIGAIGALFGMCSPAVAAVACVYLLPPLLDLIRCMVYGRAPSYKITALLLTGITVISTFIVVPAVLDIFPSLESLAHTWHYVGHVGIIVLKGLVSVLETFKIIIIPMIMSLVTLFQSTKAEKTITDTASVESAHSANSIVSSISVPVNSGTNTSVANSQAPAPVTTTVAAIYITDTSKNSESGNSPSQATTAHPTNTISVDVPSENGNASAQNSSASAATIQVAPSAKTPQAAPAPSFIDKIFRCLP